MSNGPNRREFLAGALAAGAVAALGPTRSIGADGVGKPAAGAFRFVHLTDIHVEPELHAGEGFAKALKAVEALRPRPDCILTGGDLVFDALEASPQRARELFTLYKKVLADNTSIKTYNTVGNHDVLGWASKGGVTASTPGYGKAMVKDLLELPQTYHRFDHKGWRFFCLDNIQPGRDEQHAYEGFIDGPQLDWLKAELAKTDTKMPIVMCEHIPTLSVTAFGHEDFSKDGAWMVDQALLCKDAATRLPLLRTRNVRLSLSGHMHERDRVEYFGTTFINDGAVCGNWWKGEHRGVKEGFGVFDLKGDGSFAYNYLEYGWEARE